MAYIDEILETVLQPPQLSQHLVDMEKSIEVVIDGLVKDLEHLRVSHREHIKLFMENQKGRNTLQRKLIETSSLEVAEATGNCFFEMLQ